MAARRAQPKGIGSAIAGEPARPTPGEVTEAIEAWRAAEHARKVAYDLEVEARTRMVDVLHRCGLKGVVL